MSEIDVSTLRQLTNDLLLRLESRGISKVELEADYYWNVPREHRYDPYEQPAEFTIGQLSEDLASVNELANGASPPITYALVWISTLLRYIGEKIVY